MGGVAGMIRFDGRAVSFDDITHIQHHLKHRGKIMSQVNEQGVLWAFGGSIEADNTIDLFATADADVTAGCLGFYWALNARQVSHH